MFVVSRDILNPWLGSIEYVIESQQKYAAVPLPVCACVCSPIKTNTIMDTKDDVTEIKEDIKRIEEKIDKLN